MTPEEISALIQQTISTLKDDLLAEVDKKNQGTAASLTKQLKKLQDDLKSSPTNPSTEENSDEEVGGNTQRYSKADKVLLQRVDQLERERAQEKEDALKAKRRAAISDLVSSQQLNQPELVKKLLLTDYESKITEEGGVWYVEDGDKVTTLKETFDSFLKTEQGSYFLPPSGTAGAGTKESTKPAATAKPQDPLLAAFSQLGSVTEK